MAQRADCGVFAQSVGDVGENVEAELEDAIKSEAAKDEVCQLLTECVKHFETTVFFI